MARKKKIEEKKSIWAELWAEYKAEWKALWNEYKSIIIPFIVGTIKYAWQLVYGLLKLIGTGIYETGKVLLNKLIEIIKKA